MRRFNVPDQDLEKNIGSPCTGVCRLTANQEWCVGCGRTPEELLDWRRKSPDDRQRIMLRAKQRLGHDRARARD